MCHRTKGEIRLKPANGYEPVFDREGKVGTVEFLAILYL